MADAPRITPLIIESHDPTGPYGAKGVGEPSLIPTAPAIANGASRALGVRMTHLPLSLERVMEALKQTRNSKSRNSKQIRMIKYSNNRKIPILESRPAAGKAPKRGVDESGSVICPDRGKIVRISVLCDSVVNSPSNFEFEV